MTIPNLKAQIAVLSELQKLDSRIYRLKMEKDGTPAQIKELEAAFEAKKQRLAELEKTVLEVQKQRKEREGELATNEEHRKKLQGQLYSLKTNQEYNTMLKQIADAKADASVIEDKILQLMDAADKAKSDVEQEKGRVAVEEKAFNEQKKKVQDRVREIDAEVATLDTQRSALLPSVDTKLLAQYEKILHNRQGIALAAVKDYSCQGCNMSLPPQKVNLVQMYDEIVTCESCNRILYIEETS
jgi:uncharacterized protein